MFRFGDSHFDRTRTFVTFVMASEIPKNGFVSAEVGQFHFMRHRNTQRCTVPLRDFTSCGTSAIYGRGMILQYSRGVSCNKFKVQWKRGFSETSVSFLGACFAEPLGVRGVAA